MQCDYYNRVTDQSRLSEALWGRFDCRGRPGRELAGGLLGGLLADLSLPALVTKERRAIDHLANASLRKVPLLANGPWSWCLVESARTDGLRSSKEAVVRRRCQPQVDELWT